MMRTASLIVITGLGFVSASQAIVLYSPPVARAGRAMDCVVSNVGSVPMAIQIEVIADSGQSVGGSGTTLAPGEATRGGIAAGGILGNNDMGYCKITAVGKRRDVRALLCLGTTSGGCETVAGEAH